MCSSLSACCGGLESHRQSWWMFSPHNRSTHVPLILCWSDFVSRRSSPFPPPPRASNPLAVLTAAETSNGGDPLVAATSTARRRPDLVRVFFVERHQPVLPRVLGRGGRGAVDLTPALSLFPQPLVPTETDGLRMHTYITYIHTIFRRFFSIPHESIDMLSVLQQYLHSGFCC